jgi:Trypsin
MRWIGTSILVDGRSFIIALCLLGPIILTQSDFVFDPLHALLFFSLMSVQLIAPDIVLTAGHCSESFNEVQVGRFNLTDETEQYDSLIVESINTHPQYYRNRFLDPDPHDFAVVKLFGQATIPTRTTNTNPIVKINRDDTIPTPNQAMHVAGWGAVDPLDWNEQSDVLRETDAYYIPTDDCKGYAGTYKGHDIDFSKVVVDGASLCAMNFDELSDSCRGDSGGPLVVQQQQEDQDQSSSSVLVGIVSAGYGCANPDLPALYARVSHVHDWIRDMVCELSVDPPDDFDCPSYNGNDGNFDNNPFLPCDHTQPRGESDNDISTGCSGEGGGRPNIPWTIITLELHLDTRPKERGWILRYLDDKRGIYTTVAERPIRSYADSQPWSIVSEAVAVPTNREYQLVLLDSFGDGHESFSLMDDTATETTPLIRVTDLDGIEVLSANQFQSRGDDDFYTLFDFVVGIPPTESPTTTPSPTQSLSPSSAPTVQRPFIIVVIRFGAVPQNIGFRLERLHYNDNNIVAVAVAEERQSVIEDDEVPNWQAELLHVVYPNSFSSELINGETTVEVPLDHLSGSTPQTYRFTMTSNEGVGFTNGGSYEVWLGEPFDRQMLFSGGGEDDEFHYESSHVFVIDPMHISSESPHHSASSSPVDTSGAVRSVVLGLSLSTLLGIVCF